MQTRNKIITFKGKTMQTKLSISQTNGTTTVKFTDGTMNIFNSLEETLNNLGITSDKLKKVSANQYFVNYVITQ